MIESKVERIDLPMYSVKELSELLEVSRQTVYNYLKDYSKELEGHIFRNKNMTCVDEEGLKIIKIEMGLIQVPIIQESDMDLNDIAEILKSGLLEELRSDSLKLREEHKQDLKDLKIELSEEIQELKTQNEALMKSIEDMKEEIKDKQNEGGFFSRLFKKKDTLKKE